MRRAVFANVGLGVAAFAASAVAEVPFQPLADFGLGGSPSDVNAAGRIVGAVRVEDGSYPYLPVVWETPTSTPVVLPNEFGGYAISINSNGDICGIEFQESGPYGTPVVWLDGERFVLPDLGEGGFTNDINEAGVVVGSVISDGNYLAARWVDLQLEVLPVPDFEVPDGVVWTLANSINSSGVITGTVRGQAGSGTPSAAVRWDSEGVSIVPSEGLETKGISIDNLGGVLINGYFGSPSRVAPALVMPDGQVNVLPVPMEYFSGASATAMSRTGIVAGYYYGDVNGSFGIKAAAWPNGVFTPLAMPEGQRYAFPSGVGSNGIVFGAATDGVSGRSVPGFWQLEVGENFVEASTVSGERGETVEVSAVSLSENGVNAGCAVWVVVQGEMLGLAITDSKGVARLEYTIPASFKGTEIEVEFTDENGASANGMIVVETGCTTGDLNCDGLINGTDLATLLAAWGGGGPADLNEDGTVNGIDLAIMLAGWTG